MVPARAYPPSVMAQGVPIGTPCSHRRRSNYRPQQGQPRRLRPSRKPLRID